MCADGQTDMKKLIVPFSNWMHLTRSHFLSICSQTQKVSITQVGNFVETRPSAVALNETNSKQRDKIFAIYNVIAQIFSPTLLLLLLLLYLFSLLCKVFTIIYLKQHVIIFCTVLQLFCKFSLCYM